MTRLRPLVVTAFSLTLLATAAGAQVPAVDPGSLMLGGTASYTSTGSDVADDRATHLTVQPSFEYFMAPRVGVGASVNILRQSRSGLTSSVLAVGPRASYYFARDGVPVIPYLTGAATVGRMVLETDDFRQGQTFTGYRAAAGMLFLLRDSVGLNGELFYDANRAIDDDGRNLGQNTFGLAMGFSVFLF